MPLSASLVALLVIMQATVGNCCSPPSEVLCSVGSIRITTGDVIYQERIDSIYSGHMGTREGALVEQIGEAIERAVLQKAYDLSPPIEALREKSAWIDSTTHDPIRLKFIHDLFGTDTASYYGIFVAPVLVNARLHDAFRKDTALQRIPRKSIEAMWSVISTDPARLYDYPFDTIVTEKVAPQQEEASLVEKVLSHLSVGTLWNHVIEDDWSFKILMLISETDSAYRSFVIMVAKTSFDSWFKQYVRDHVAITFYDTSLESAVRNSYPNLWWLQSRSG